MRRILHALQNLLIHLTEPHPSVTEPDQRVGRRALTGLFLVTGVLTLMVFPLPYFLLPDRGNTPYRMVLALFGGLLMLASYLFIRRGRPQLAAWNVVMMGSGLVLLSAIWLDPIASERILAYLIVLVLFAGIVFAPWIALMTFFGQAIAALMLMAAGVLPITLDVLLQGPLVFNLIMTLLIVAFTAYFRYMEYLRRKRLSDSLTVYRALFENTNDAVFLLDLNGQHKAFNQRAADLLGYPLEELAGIAMEQVIVAEELPKSRDVLARLKAGERIPNYQRHFRHKEGHAIPMEINASLVRAEDGTPLHIQSIARDLRERQRVEQQRLRVELERERLTLMRRFVEAISHDFRTSLTHIEMNRYLIERSLPPADAQHQQPRLHRIQEHVLRLTGQIENISIVSALLNLKLNMHDLNTLVQQAAKEFGSTADQRGIEFRLSLAERMLPVCCDEDKLLHALHHLLINAVQHTPAGATITLSTAVIGGQAAVQMRDTGRGIAPEHLPHVFDFFYRADAARPVSTGGVGLGLSIVQMIMDAHGGEVQVESVVGEGTTFTLLLPLITARDALLLE